MEDNRWTTKDRKEQLKGIKTIYNNKSAKDKEKSTALIKKQNKDIKNLTALNTKYRQEYKEIAVRDKTLIQPMFQPYPRLNMALKNLEPTEVEDEINQLIFCKNKELDRLRFKKKNLEEVFLQKKLEMADLNKETEEFENHLWEQEIANQIQSISVKLSAARANRAVYEKAINVLQKDAIRYDEVLDGLRKDLVHQCESIVNAMEMGQSVSEDLHGLQREYKVRERSVRANMKKRDKDIRELKADLDNLRLHGHTLHESRPEATPNIGVPSLSDDTEDLMENQLNQELKNEVTELESLLAKVKLVTKVPSLVDICFRVKEMKKQQESLLKKAALNQIEVDRMLQLHNQLDVMLEVAMYHTMTEEAAEAQELRKELRMEIKDEQEDLKQAEKALVGIGNNIVSIRTALMSLNMTLDNVYPQPGEGSSMELQISASFELDHSDTKLKPLTQPNMDPLYLLEMIVKKAKWLVDKVGVLGDQETPLVTTQFALVSMMSRISRLGTEDESDNIVSDLLDELEELDDPSIVSRKDIKNESQKLVEFYDNPQRKLLEHKAPTFKKHKCF